MFRAAAEQQQHVVLVPYKYSRENCCHESDWQMGISYSVIILRSSGWYPQYIRIWSEGGRGSILNKIGHQVKKFPVAGKLARR
jgi:hypothetical protein